MLRPVPLFLLRWVLVVLVVTATAVIAGCSAGASSIAGALSLVRINNQAVDQARLDPRFFYLRVTNQGRAALLVLGFQDAVRQGQAEVWYSHDNEMLRLQGGRLIGTGGLNVNWQAVRFPDGVPAWPDASHPTSPAFTRVVDSSPGYGTGLQHTLQLQQIAPPASNALAGLDAGQFDWVQENIVQAGPGAPALPAARYALTRTVPARVVYGEQCLAASFCISWQYWPVRGPVPP